MASSAATSRTQLGADDLISPYVGALQAEIKRLYSTNISLRLKACIEIGHIVYHGGETLEMTLLNDGRIVDGLLAVFTGEKAQPVPLIVAALRTLSIIVRSSSEIINVLDSRRTIQVLLDKLGHADEEVRIFACNCLYFYLLKRVEAFGPLVLTPDNEALLRRAALDDWTNFNYNDAEEIMKLLEIKYDPYVVSSCIHSRTRTAVQQVGEQAGMSDGEQD